MKDLMKLKITVQILTNDIQNLKTNFKEVADGEAALQLTVADATKIIDQLVTNLTLTKEEIQVMNKDITD